MSADDEMESRGGGIQIKGVDVVQDVECCEISFDDFCFGQGPRPRVGINISAHGKNRGHSF